MTTIEAVNARNGNGHLLEAILKICRAYYATNELPGYYLNFYKMALDDERSVVCVIRENEEITGYILGIPQDCAAMQFVEKADPQIAKDPDRYYVDTLEVLKGQKNPFSFVKLIKELVREVKDNGKNKFSMYVRPHVSEKLLKVLRRWISKDVAVTRNVMADWYGVSESYDYIELQLQ
ncbi:MAG: hypothetical protein A3J76_00235 [Candidatus Moranbacteria bacterium RBG_13_45_13]|nr:MAG: hypothetical protein A3J76_00235 [Candidatus Moranbacteria bacterium RBG_13_45_13]